MGRRGDHGLDKIKEMAIEAAEALVAAGGVEALSARKVAGKIGYSAGTLYLVFKDINDLVLHVNGRTLERLRAALEAAGRRHGDDERAVHAVCRAYLDFAAEHPALWSLLFGRQWGPGFTRPDWYQARKMDCFRPLAERLKALGLARGERGLEALTLALWASVHGTWVLSQDDKLSQAGAREGRALLELQIDLFLKGARARGGGA